MWLMCTHNTTKMVLVLGHKIEVLFKFFKVTSLSFLTRLHKQDE